MGIVRFDEAACLPISRQFVQKSTESGMRFETDPDFRNPSWDLPRSQIGSLSFHGITTDGLVVEVAAFGIFEGGTMSERMSRRGLFSFLSRPLRGPVKSAGQHFQTAFSKQPPSPLPASGLFGDTVAVVPTET